MKWRNRLFNQWHKSISNKGENKPLERKPIMIQLLQKILKNWEKLGFAPQAEVLAMIGFKGR